MKQAEFEFSISTKGRGIYSIHKELEDWMGCQNIQSGLLTVFIPHTSASLLIQENADPDVRTDLDAFFARLVPDRDQIYRHIDEGPDDMPSHVRSALTASTLSIPVTRGALALGTWQGIYLWEHRTRPHHRSVTVTISGTAK